MAKKNLKSIVITCVVVALVAAIIPASCTIVDRTERGVEVLMGQIVGDVIQPGVKFHVPFAATVKKYSIVPKSKSTTFSVGKDGAITKDMQTVGSAVTVYYQYDESRIMEAATKYSDPIIDNAMTQNLIASLKEAVGAYSIYELVENQSDIRAAVEEKMINRMAMYPIKITQLTIANWDWSDDFDKQIKETMNRTQEVRKAEQDLKLAETNAQKQVAEAEAAKQAAEQEAEAQLIRAQKSAEAKKVEADALAYYNKKVAENYQVEIKLKELEIELERAKHWNGKEVPDYVPLTAAGAIVTLPGNGN